jgi:hypothetical protein
MDEMDFKGFLIRGDDFKIVDPIQDRLAPASHRKADSVPSVFI